MDITGKTIQSAVRMKKPGYDDSGWLTLNFTDGTSCTIEASYCCWTGASKDEYPTYVHVSDAIDDLVPSENQDLNLSDPYDYLFLSKN